MAVVVSLACHVESMQVCEDSLDKLVHEDAESLPSTDLETDSLRSSVDLLDDSDSESESEADEFFDSADTLIVFDYDDTILPTSWLKAQGLDDVHGAVISEAQREELESLARHAEKTLLAAQALGEVVFVTNAGSGWLELSCQEFLPSLAPLLLGVRTISARSTYEPQGVASPAAWKRLAFDAVVSSFCRRKTTQGRARNFVSIGDSWHERDALLQATENISECSVKCVKLADRPDVDQLVREHDVIGECLRHIVQHSNSIDICIEG